MLWAGLVGRAADRADTPLPVDCCVDSSAALSLCGLPLLLQFTRAFQDLHIVPEHEARPFIPVHARSWQLWFKPSCHSFFQFSATKTGACSAKKPAHSICNALKQAAK